MSFEVLEIFLQNSSIKFRVGSVFNASFTCKDLWTRFKHLVHITNITKKECEKIINKHKDDYPRTRNCYAEGNKLFTIVLRDQKLLMYARSRRRRKPLLEIPAEDAVRYKGKIYTISTDGKIAVYVGASLQKIIPKPFKVCWPDYILGINTKAEQIIIGYYRSYPFSSTYCIYDLKRERYLHPGIPYEMRGCLVGQNIFVEEEKGIGIYYYDEQWNHILKRD